jgi:hypothetical protein
MLSRIFITCLAVSVVTAKCATEYPCTPFLIKHPALNRYWTLDEYGWGGGGYAGSSVVRLTQHDQSPMTLAVEKRKDVQSAEKGYVALRSIDGYIRHASFALHSNPLHNDGPKFDFAWKLERDRASGLYRFLNEYGGGYTMGYDAGSDTVLIVTFDDSRATLWAFETVVPDCQSPPPKVVSDPPMVISDPPLVRTDAQPESIHLVLDISHGFIAMIAAVVALLAVFLVKRSIDAMFTRYSRLPVALAAAEA